MPFRNELTIIHILYTVVPFMDWAQYILRTSLSFQIKVVTISGTFVLYLQKISQFAPSY